MTLSIALQFAFATLLPVVASAVLTALDKRTPFGSMSYWPRQILIGLVFGGIAIFGTELGIVTNDATMNVRDAAPIVAGLYFGGPAGIIAGIIGGVERWFAALWGRGMFTREACSIATIAAGLYAAIARRYLFDGRRPDWLMAGSIGTANEVLHLLLVFMTNLDQPVEAYRVVLACTLPMVACNALSAALSGIVITLMTGHKLFMDTKRPEITQLVQTGMLVGVALAFCVTMAVVSSIHSGLIETNTRKTLSLALEDTEQDIEDASDMNLLALALAVANEVPSVDEANQETIDTICVQYELSEINIVNDDGIIVMSTDPSYVGFDMSSGDQASEFLNLLPGGSSSQIVQDFQPITKDETVWRKYAGVTIKGGFLQVSYDGDHFNEDLRDEIKFAVANRHIGNEGLFVVLSTRDVLVGIRKGVNITYNDVSKLSGAMESQRDDEVFELSFRGQEYYAMYRSTENMRVLAMIPTSEVQVERNLSILITSFMEVIAFAALFIAIYLLIENEVVESIWQVNGRLRQITNGDLEIEVDVRDSVEFASLSDDINRTVGALRDAIAAEGRRIERDLSTAKAIQESALPRTFPPFPDVDAFDIYALMNAAKEVGGDFYDFFLVDDHTLAFLIADVSGKGIPGALFMMAAKSELANYIKSGMELSEAVHSANWNLCQGNDAGMFVTVWAATLNFQTGELTYVNAGHNPPLLRHEREWSWLRERGGLFLGTFETAKYRSATITLVEGDELLLYTDGVNEAFSAEGEEYGNDRLKGFLDNHTRLHPHLLVETLRSDVGRWAAGAEQSDDITILALEYGKPPEVSGTITVPDTPEGLSELMRRMHYEFGQLQCPEVAQEQIDIVIEELFTSMVWQSAMSTGTTAVKSEARGVELSYFYDTIQNALTVSLSSYGEPFNPLSSDAAGFARIDAAAMDDYVDDISYIRDDDRNVVAFRKDW